MIQIFLLGSSNVYGAGGEGGGWADLIKQKLHHKMYSGKGTGEKYEIYNFGKSGETIDFVLKTFPQQLKQYGRKGKVISVVSVGGNNIKAENTPSNFVSTLEDYTKQMSLLLNLLKKLSSYVIAVGSGSYDESKTSPKYNPLTGAKSYFNNKRKQLFESNLKKLCEAKNITFIEINVSEAEWITKYLYKDGLHPNKKGHELISKLVLTELKKLI